MVSVWTHVLVWLHSKDEHGQQPLRTPVSTSRLTHQHPGRVEFGIAGRQTTATPTPPVV